MTQKGTAVVIVSGTHEGQTGTVIGRWEEFLKVEVNGAEVAFDFEEVRKAEEE